MSHAYECEVAVFEAALNLPSAERLAAIQRFGQPYEDTKRPEMSAEWKQELARLEAIK